MTETIQAKATRLLAEGRLLIAEVDADTITASLEGDTGTHRLGLTPGGWWCSCPTPTPRCSHLAALRLVTVTQPRKGATP